jgi:putative PIN family toxin of toxin-antitoxin system
MHRLVVDTNVAVSGLLSSGPGTSIFRLAGAGRLSLWGSSETFTEFCRVIRYPRIEKKIRAQYRGVLAFENEYARLLNRTSITGVLPGVLVPADRDDEMFIRVAVSSESRLIVTRDNHLLELHPFGEVMIITPEDFMEAWRVVTLPRAPKPARRWYIPWAKRK